jgi:hypothetical protein
MAFFLVSNRFLFMASLNLWRGGSQDSPARALDSLRAGELFSLEL